MNVFEFERTRTKQCVFEEFFNLDLEQNRRWHYYYDEKLFNDESFVVLTEQSSVMSYEMFVVK